jgi:hypothetical protein
VKDLKILKDNKRKSEKLFEKGFEAGNVAQIWGVPVMVRNNAGVKPGYLRYWRQ